MQRFLVEEDGRGAYGMYKDKVPTDQNMRERGRLKVRMGTPATRWALFRAC